MKVILLIFSLFFFCGACAYQSPIYYRPILELVADFYCEESYSNPLFELMYLECTTHFQWGMTCNFVYAGQSSTCPTNAMIKEQASSSCYQQNTIGLIGLFVTCIVWITIILADWLSERERVQVHNNHAYRQHFCNLFYGFEENND